MKLTTSISILVTMILGADALAGTSAPSNVAQVTTLPPPVVGGPFTIPASHPRLWFNAARLVQAKQWYATHPFNPSATSPNGAKECALRYLLTGETAYARNAINFILGYTIAQAQLDGVASDSAKNDGRDIILVYDWCYDQMTASERATIINRWNGYLSTLRGKSWGGPGMPSSNYYWAYLSNELEWGIATYGENSQAQSFLDFALDNRWKNSFLPYTSGEGKGGVLAEGNGYGAVLPWYPLVPFETVSFLGRNIYGETDFYKEAVFAILYSLTPATTATVKQPNTVCYELIPFNDVEYPDKRDIFHVRTYYGDFLSVMANKWAALPVGQYARRVLNLVQPNLSRQVAALDAGGTEKDFGTLPLDYYAPGIQYLYARNQWGANATSILLQLGSPTAGGHTHLDFGSWQIWRNGRWASRETTGYSNHIVGYGGADVLVNATIAHNGILFGGLGIPRAYRDGNPQVIRLENKPAYSYAVVDLSQAYKSYNSGYPITQFGNQFANTILREFLFIRSLETLVVFDRLQSQAYGGTTAESVKKTFLAHSEQTITVQDGTHVLLNNGSQELRLTTLVPSNPTYRVVDEGFQPVGQFRLEVETSGSAQSYFLHVLQARDATGANVTSTVADNGNSYTVNVGGNVIVFNKGAASSGGTFNGQALRGDVQTMDVIDSGPVWK